MQVLTCYRDNCKRLLAKSRGRQEVQSRTRTTTRTIKTVAEPSSLLAPRVSLSNTLEKNRDYGVQIGINRVLAGAIHGMTEHSRMHGVAQNIYRAAQIDVRVDVACFLGSF